MPAQVNRALVMSGGGAKGAFQVGALRHLIKDLGLDFQVIAGVSTGSLSAALLAQGKGPEGLIEQYDRLESLWLSIRSNDDIYKKRFLGKLLLLFFRDSIYSSEPLRKKLSDSVNLEKLRTSGKELRIGSVCFETGAYRTASQEDDAIREWTLGSSSMPLMFPPVRIGASTAVDGGVRNVTPLGDAFAALKSLPHDGVESPDEMYVLLASPLETEQAKGPFDNGMKIAKRTVSILVNEIYLEDLDYACAINESVRFYEQIKADLAQRLDPDTVREILEKQKFRFRPPSYHHVVLRVVVPGRSYSEALDFDPKTIKEAFQAGRLAASNPLTEERIVALLEARGLREKAGRKRLSDGVTTGPTPKP